MLVFPHHGGWLVGSAVEYVEIKLKLERTFRGKSSLVNLYFNKSLTKKSTVLYQNENRGEWRLCNEAVIIMALQWLIKSMGNLEEKSMEKSVEKSVEKLVEKSVEISVVEKSKNKSVEKSVEKSMENNGKVQIITKIGEKIGGKIITKIGGKIGGKIITNIGEKIITKICWKR